MRRRSFLRATLAAVGGSLLAPACSGDDPAPVEGDTGADVGGDVEEVLVDGTAVFTLSVASGDPRPESVVLWTRVAPPAAGGDVAVALQVALDDAFTSRVTVGGRAELELSASADHDHCVKVRLTELTPATVYYYRFIVRDGSAAFVSRVGRTRTAPDPTSDVPVRFAYVSCQDINGRYYNTYKRLIREELDFVVHLGDYVYETTGDPSFQDTAPGRVVTFTDVAGAVALEEDGTTFYSAASLSNYRELYQIYRADPWLQRVHERYPMIVIWDDHEYSDDCHGVTSTMYGGREDEATPERRARANQAWFEYMPVDYGDPNFAYDAATSPPDGLRIYRDLRYGANLHLVLTDLRLYRPDHLVAEDAFPGRVVLREEELVAAQGAVPEWADAYVDVDAHAGGAYADALRAGAPIVGYDPVHATGLVAVRTINKVVAALIEAGTDTWTPIDTTAELPRGLAHVTLGKASPYSSIGSRYLAIRDPYLVYARHQFIATSGASEDLLGPEQEGWFLETMRGSDAVWKVWGNEFCLVPRVVDTRAFAVPADFQKLFLLSVEDWDGAPNKRDELITALSQVGNVVAITGDIHAFFAGTPWVSDQQSRRITELVGSSVSSATYEKLLVKTAAADPALRDAGASALALLVEDMLTDPVSATNPHLAYANINENGFVIVDVSAEELNATYLAIGQNNARQDLAEDALDAAFTETRFQVRAGAPDLYQERDGVFMRWDSTLLAWV